MSVALSEQVLPVNGIDLHVTQAGTGEPLLLIHGVTVDATFERLDGQLRRPGPCPGSARAGQQADPSSRRPTTLCATSISGQTCPGWTGRLW